MPVVSQCRFIIPKLNLDVFADVTNVQVSVNTEVPGLAAEEVEQLITYPIEAVMYALPDVGCHRGRVGDSHVFDTVCLAGVVCLVFKRQVKGQGINL